MISDKERKSVERLLNDIGDSPHRFRHPAAFQTLVEKSGLVVKELDHGRIAVRDPADVAAEEKAAAEASEQKPSKSDEGGAKARR